MTGAGDSIGRPPATFSLLKNGGDILPAFIKDHLPPGMKNKLSGR